MFLSYICSFRSILCCYFFAGPDVVTDFMAKYKFEIVTNILKGGWYVYFTWFDSLIQLKCTQHAEKGIREIRM